MQVGRVKKTAISDVLWSGLFRPSRSHRRDNYAFNSSSKEYISCLKDQKDKHYLCRDLSKEYLQCRMDRQLMVSEDLDKVRVEPYLIQSDLTLYVLVASHITYHSSDTPIAPE